MAKYIHVCIEKRDWHRFNFIKLNSELLFAGKFGRIAKSNLKIAAAIRRGSSWRRYFAVRALTPAVAKSTTRLACLMGWLASPPSF
jgi:hypothetical protein